MELTHDNFLQKMKTRRTCRNFSTAVVDVEIIKTCIAAAATAPSGANTQPWFFAVVTDPNLKSEIRQAAEIEEQKFYAERATEDLLNALKPFNTDWQKEHLADASALIIIFSKNYNIENGEQKKCYYPKESVGIATGMLISALHLAGLDTLTHTPNPMFFLNRILNRPPQERPFLILAVGHASLKNKPAVVTKKSFDEICQIN